MPRVKITKQKQYNHKLELTIRVSDLNYGAHLAYDKVLTLAHQARVELFDTWNINEMDLGDGTGLVVGDAIVNYIGEGFLNDKIIIETTPLEIGSITFRLSHRFINLKTQKEIVLAEIGFVGFDYKKRMPGKLPSTFLEKLNSLI
jgi:acyl-CoA thioester hydrolase